MRPTAISLLRRISGPLARVALPVALLATLGALGNAPARPSPAISGADVPRDPLPPDSIGTFALTATVTPASAPIGAPFEFRLIVTNTGEETRTFGVDGCPVNFLVDGVYMPFRACPEYYREIVLAPGQSITFGPDEDGALRFDPHRFPVGPGTHEVALWIAGVGEARATFSVGDPEPNVAYAAGQVIRENYLRQLGTARLIPVTSDPATGVVGPGDLETTLGDQGHFLFDAIPPGSYFLSVTEGDRTWFYPGVEDPAQAGILDLPAGVYTDGIQVVLPPIDPWPGFYRVETFVYEARTDSAAAPALAGAMVIAVPLFGGGTDDTVIVPGDSTGVVPGDSAGVGPPSGSSHPEMMNRFMAWTDEAGRAVLELPEGSYRLLAGKLGSHGYRYWPGAFRFEEAGIFPVPNKIQSPRFDLPLLEDARLAVITGRVLGYDPMTDGPPEPIEGAVVTAVPVLPPHMLGMVLPTAVTGPDGAYRLEIPADTPYLVSASASGFDDRFYRNAYLATEAQWVDVRPGLATEGIDFTLSNGGPGPGLAAIEGVVLRPAAPGETPPDGSPAGLDSTLVPVAGALVRVVPSFPTFAAMEYRTFTGPDGRFRVDDIAASPDGSLSYFVSAQIENGDAWFYPGGVPFPEAVPLAVFPGGVSDTGPIVLGGGARDDSGFLGGRITDPEGTPILHALVRVYVDPEHPDGRVVRALTGEDGRFAIGGLPEGAYVLVSAEAPGRVPAYYPGVKRWRQAQPVVTTTPFSRIAPLEMTLFPAAATGPYVQAGLVLIQQEVATDDSSWVDPGPLGWRDARALNHPIGVGDAFFYLVNALAMGPMEAVVAGASTGENGAAVLAGLPGGTYLAYADRPGFESAYFANAAGEPVPIELNASTPGVLASIRLHPLYFIGDHDAAGATMVSRLTNVPNPFRPETSIRYRLEETVPVTVQVFDQQGRLVRTLLRDVAQLPGDHAIPWDGRGEDGSRTGSGVYFTRVVAGTQSFVRKMVVLP